MELKFIWNWLYCCLFVIEYLTNKISEDEKQKYFCLIFHLREPHSWTHFLPTATVTNQSKSVEKHCRGRLNTAKLCNAVQHHHKRHPPRWSYSWKKIASHWQDSCNKSLLYEFYNLQFVLQRDCSDFTKVFSSKTQNKTKNPTSYWVCLTYIS